MTLLQVLCTLPRPVLQQLCYEFRVPGSISKYGINMLALILHKWCEDQGQIEHLIHRALELPGGFMGQIA